jgi:site-specific DNA recombinase
MSHLKLVKIGLYARVSSEKQAQEKTIESQISCIIDYSNSVGERIDPDLHFIDDGISGAYLERPGLDKLRDKALLGEVTKVYILSPDRLSRKSAHQVLLIEEMKRLGVSFSFVNRQIGDTPEDQMLLQIQGIVAEYEREKILERSRRGKLYAAKRGKVNVLGGAPYGYHYKKGIDTQDATYLIHPEEASVVKEAYFLYCKKDYSIGEIARQFTEKAYITRSGKMFWERSVIWGMLRNPAYKGTAAFRKTKRVSRIRKTKLAIDNKNKLSRQPSSSRDRPKEDWIYIPVPAIISEKDFDFAQQTLKNNIKFSPRNNKKHNYLLSGLLRCKTCGYSIYGKPASNSKYKRLYYRCSGQDGHRWAEGRVCAGHPVRVEAIDDLVWESLKNLLLTPETIVSEYQRRLGTIHIDHEAIISQKNNEVNRYKKERDRLIDLFQSGLVEKSEIEMKLKNVRSKLEQLSNEINYLVNQESESKKMLTLIRNLDDFSLNIGKNLDAHSFAEKRKMVKFLVEEVEVDTVNEAINVKHIIPLDPKRCQLRPGTHDTALRCTASTYSYITFFVLKRCCKPPFNV